MPTQHIQYGTKKKIPSTQVWLVLPDSVQFLSLGAPAINGGGIHSYLETKLWVMNSYIIHIHCINGVMVGLSSLHLSLWLLSDLLEHYSIAIWGIFVCAVVDGRDALRWYGRWVALSWSDHSLPLIIVNNSPNMHNTGFLPYWSWKLRKSETFVSYESWVIYKNLNLCDHWFQIQWPCGGRDDFGPLNWFGSEKYFSRRNWEMSHPLSPVIMLGLRNPKKKKKMSDHVGHQNSTIFGLLLDSLQV